MIHFLRVGTDGHCGRMVRVSAGNDDRRTARVHAGGRDGDPNPHAPVDELVHEQLREIAFKERKSERALVPEGSNVVLERRGSRP
jgi:hypothetical protein